MNSNMKPLGKEQRTIPFGDEILRKEVTRKEGERPKRIYTQNSWDSSETGQEICP